MGEHDRVPLTEAAFQLGQTYHQVRTMILRGELRGGRDAFGHWFAEAGALRSLKRAATIRPAARDEEAPIRRKRRG